MRENKELRVAFSMLDDIIAEVDSIKWAALSYDAFLGRHPVMSIDEISEITIQVEKLLEDCEIVEKKIGSDKEALAKLNFVKGRLYSLYFPFKLPRYKSHKKEAISCYEKAIQLTSSEKIEGLASYYLGRLYNVWKQRPEAIENLEKAVILLSVEDQMGMEAAKELQRLKTKKKGMCFLAGAVYGSPLAQEVVILQSFRDKFLERSTLGRVFIIGYYRFSPFFARLINQSEVLKKIVRMALIDPLVKVVRSIYRDTVM